MATEPVASAKSSLDSKLKGLPLPSVTVQTALRAPDTAGNSEAAQFIPQPIVAHRGLTQMKFQFLRREHHHPAKKIT